MGVLIIQLNRVFIQISVYNAVPQRPSTERSRNRPAGSKAVLEIQSQIRSEDTLIVQLWWLVPYLTDGTDAWTLLFMDDARRRTGKGKRYREMVGADNAKC